jgi:hypothetical protein
MAWQVVIDFELPPGGLARNTMIHRLRNFGEALWHEARTSGLAKVDLGEVDKATDQLCLREIKTRRVRTVMARVRGLLEDHHLSDVASVSQIAMS